jgi:hypothetical protein
LAHHAATTAKIHQARASLALFYPFLLARRLHFPCSLQELIPDLPRPAQPWTLILLNAFPEWTVKSHTETKM